MEIIGYIAAIFIGLTLGLIGGGGSILTVPVLAYLFGYSPVLATAYSLFVVGSTSLVGSVDFYRRGLVDVRTAVVFGAPSVVMVYLTRAFIVPAIPDVVFESSGYSLSKDLLIMALFAVLMIFASVSMIRGRGKLEAKSSLRSGPDRKFNYPVILAEGAVVGLLTGLVGAGGGFLIIPALVFFSGLDMKMAVGTSLLIIAAKSLIGFLGDLSNYEMEWRFLLTFTAISVAGIFIGGLLSKKIEGERLKKGFGYFVLIMGIYILSRELIF